MHQQTVDMLTDMKLSAMAAEFTAQLQDPSFYALSFEERFSMAVTAEWNRWCQNINSTSPNEKFPIHISMVQQRNAEGGSHIAKQHDKQFKLDSIQYYEAQKDLDVRGCAENLGIGYSTLTKWLKDFRESGDIPVRGSGNYASDEQKEIARLRRELRDAQDALDVLKKAINILGK